MGWWWISRTKSFVFAVIVAVIIFLLLDLVDVPLASALGYLLLFLAAVIFILLTKVVDRARAKGQ